MIDNIRWILNIIFYCQNENSEALTLSLDFTKMFDSIDISYLHLLANMKFGPRFF